MCRVFGCVAAEPITIRQELIEGENPLVRQSEVHDSGWGMAVYRTTEGREPSVVRFPEAAFAGASFEHATALRGRIFNVHVRRATLGGLTLENTHPFLLGNYSFAHNGTVIAYPRLLEPGVPRPAGETDSEAIFNYLMRYFDPGEVAGSLRRAMSAVVARSRFSGLNFLFSDGERLYAYRFGVFDLHWLARPGALLVSSEKVTDEPWHTVQQDVLLTLDPEELDEPHAERLLGDEIVARAEVDRLEEQTHLRGAERGAFAAERAARVAAAMAE
jgi:predicted glutamine amidotransferase